MKRRKVSQQTVGSSSSSQTHRDATQSASSSVKGPATATVTQDSSPDEPSRMRDIVPQWLEKQAQRLERLRRGSFWHRDSMFESQDVKREPKQTAQDVGTAVSGPHSEPVPQRVIDHFFTLYPAGGSDWRNSVRWQRHLTKCTVTKCAICKATRRLTDTSPSPARLSAKPPVKLSARSSTESLSKTSKDSYFSVPSWRSKSSKERKKRGKSPAQDEIDEEDTETLSPSTQVPRYLETSFSRRTRASRPGIVIYDGAPQFERRAPPPPVRCTSVSKPVDASKIPVPAAPHLRFASTATINVDDLSQITGRPYEISPLELLRFPLSQHYNLPSTPQLKPKQVAASVPEMEPLTGALRASSVDSLLSESSTVGPNPTNVQRWPTQPRSESSSGMGGYTIADLLSQDGGFEMPPTRKHRAAAGRPTHHASAPAPAAQYLPTPPHSRHTSNGWQAGSSVAPPTYCIAIPEGPADRDWATCKLSDTTGSSLPNCPVYVNARERLDKYWAGWAERHGPGMRNWR
ncbi:uncharacterized protein EKO05_0002207 [Ascochyta rabiei]|uniref:Uncharacterized protein n=1 Tax=Didymella rabiei TaxID=5454 RepID=A0A163JCK6_DIDRA|nr:uncharacterized protein EKO05_0002207 [Ascochyta rabiei]KZM26276.1 hypothetical protein ST47_g2570 [Ascochyta rabiei]UPX11610.1 hypothetical protein EKO05_0002207 [Ascochyta rabiei]